MTALGSGAAGLALVLSLALLCAPRIGGAILLCAAQAVVVAIAVVVQGHPWVAALELAFAASIWLVAPVIAGRVPGMTGNSAPPAQVTIGLAVGGVLALLVVTLPGTGTALAIILLGATLVAVPRPPSWQVLGLASLHNGVVLVAIGSHLSDEGLAIAVLPILPALAAGGSWLGISRTRLATLTAWSPGAWVEAAICTVALAYACSLQWQVPISTAPLRLDAFAAHIILLLAVVATAATWAQCLHRPPAAPPGARLLLLAGTSLAVVSDSPMLSWLALAIAAMAAVVTALPRRAEAWRRLRLGCLGLGIALFGTIGLHGAPPWSSALTCFVVGIGALAWLSPELALTAVAVILRQRGLVSAVPGQTAPDIVLLLAGLAALAISGFALLMRPNGHRHQQFDGFGQSGVAVFAFGLGTTEASLAGLLHLTLLALTLSAVMLSRQGGLDRVASLAGLAGLPPFGLFPSLALILAATAVCSSWLLLPLVAGLALLGWPVLASLPPLRPAPGHWQRRLAWIPLLLLLVAGFAMPGPVNAWMHTIAGGQP